MPLFLLAAFFVLMLGRGAASAEHGGPRLFVFPYYYDPYYGYDPGYPYSAYCDPYSPYYAPQYCSEDDGS